MGVEKGLFDKFLIGFFLILWSLNGYYLGGNPLKYLVLLIGILLSFSYFFKSQLFKSLSFFNFSIISISYFLVLVLKAFVQNHATTSSTLLIFGLLNILLMCVGFLIGKNHYKFVFFHNTSAILLMALTLLGVIFFFIFQNRVVSEDNSISRVGGEEGDGMNVIGVAYTNSLIFLFLFGILNSVNFKNKIYTYLNYIMMLLCLFVIIQTQSRGALMYLTVVMTLFSIKKIHVKIFVPALMRSLRYLILGILIFFVAIKLSPSLENGYDRVLNRFESLINVYLSDQEDRSIEERNYIYDDFYENYQNYIFLGKEDYVPYPHNIFMEIIQRFGIIFGLPLFALLLISIYKSISVAFNRQGNVLLTFFAMVFIFCFMQSLSSLSLEMNRSLFLSMGFLLGSLIK